jgi:replicative DNA helicase
LIEQGADLALLIYRDEYDNPETADRGITLKLLFEPQFTRFRNLAA